MVGLDIWNNSHKKWHIESREFDSMEKVYAFIDTTVGVRKRGNLMIHNIEGFYVNLRFTGKIVKDLVADDRMVKTTFDKLPLTYGIFEGGNYMIFPVYADNDTINCTFIVRYKVI